MLRGLVLDNYAVAVLTKVNELADRHGLKPYDFVATFKWDENAQDGILDFESPAQGNALREERYKKMIADIGITVTDRAVLIGDEAQIIDALDNALNIAPRTRRF
jgi:hypothetical protein